MASCATGLEMGFVVGLNSIAFGALVANPLLVITVLPSEVLLNANKIAEGVTRVVVQAAGLGAHEDPLSNLWALSL